MLKHLGFIKFLLVVFIVVAIFNYRGKTLDEWAIKTGEFLRGFTSNPSNTLQKEKTYAKNVVADTNTETIKVTPSTDSFMANFFANVFNKVLETPNGQIVIREVLNKAVSAHNKTPYAQDLEEKQYLATDIKLGNGLPVKCGDEVEITYRIYKKSDTKKDKNFLKTQIIVGRNNLATPLENAIIGMKEKGERKIVYFGEPLKTTYKKDENSQYIQYVSEVSLEKIHSPSYNKKDEVRVFVHNPSRAGKRIACGDMVAFAYKISDMNNKVLTNNNAPNRIVLGMYSDPSNSLREIYNTIVDTYKDHVHVTVILRYKQAKTLIPDLKINKKLTDNEMVIIDLYGFPSASLNDLQTDAVFNVMLNSTK